MIMWSLNLLSSLTQITDKQLKDQVRKMQDHVLIGKAKDIPVTVPTPVISFGPDYPFLVASSVCR